MVSPEQLYAVVGQHIRTVRRSRGFTQAALADAVSLTRASITNIECGRQKLLLHTLYDIAAALDVKPEAILPRDIDPEESQDFEQDLPADLSLVEQEWIRSVVAPAKERS